MARGSDVGDTIAALRRHADDLHDTVVALYQELDKLAEYTDEPSDPVEREGEEGGGRDRR